LRKVQVKLQAPVQNYQIAIGCELLPSLGVEVRRTLGPKSSRVAVISNQQVFGLYGPSVVQSLRAEKFIVTPLLIGDGERFKSLNSLSKALTFLSENGLERNDAVLALGGGVVGDLAGFAAAVYLRGIPFFQVPTTLLAQIDSSVGGKTGVNLTTGKNLVGAFHQPRGVFIDLDTLKSLPTRELTAGWCEMVKQGVVGGKDLFEQTANFLKALASNSTGLRSTKLESLVAAQCAFKAEIVGGDEREALGRTDRRSRRILNFGHTVGHALEAVTRYRRFRHGEAVGYGMLVAGEISKLLGLLDASELESLGHAVALCGTLPQAADLDNRDIISAISRDKKSVAGKIQWILLEGIGKPRIVNGQEIPDACLRDSLKAVLRSRE